MLKESLKWMILTLVAAAILIAAAVGLYRYIDMGRQPAQTAEPASTPEPAILQTSSPAPTSSPTPEPTVAPLNAEERIAAYVASLSVEQKLGQMVLFGFSGTTEPSEEYRNIFETYRVGNLILYGANVKSGNSDGGFGQCKKLIETAKETLNTGEIPPLVAIDVEGGEVVRFRWETWPASARTLGRRRDGAYAREQFAAIGKKLLETGINMNLAPVLDVSQDPMSTFLETRIISEDALVAGAIGAAVVEGLHDSGCLSTAKHFPGHGGTTKDSHDETPVIDRSAEELAGYDLVPFQQAIDAGVDAILVAHILYPALDAQDIASMSEPVITGLLRKQMGFDGVVISDDFRMGGLTSRYEISDAAVRFVLAGGDLIMCGAQSEKQRAIMEGLQAAAADGRLTEERVNESVVRILKAKGFAAE